MENRCLKFLRRLGRIAILGGTDGVSTHTENSSAFLIWHSFLFFFLSDALLDSTSFCSYPEFWLTQEGPTRGYASVKLRF